MTDHDHRLKVALKEFFPEFFAAFLPEWAERLDFSAVEWLDKELFSDPPDGARRVLDLVAKVGTREVVEPQRPDDESDEWIALVHVEIESGESAAGLRSRMYAYYELLRRTHRRPVLPVAVFLRVAGDGGGRDVFEERFWELNVLRFEYLFLGLAGLDAAAHLASGNPLDAALSVLMRAPEAEKPRLKAEALRRIIEGRHNAWRTQVLADLVQTYAPLDEAQRREFDQILTEEPYMSTMQLGKTWFEEGEELGRRRMVESQLAARFGPLTDPALDRLGRMNPAQLEALALALLTAGSLEELGLVDPAAPEESTNRG